MFDAFNGFFAYYAYLGAFIFLGSLLLSLAISLVLVKATKKGYMFSLVMLLIGLLFFVLKMPATAVFYVMLAILGAVVLIIKKLVKNKKTKND